jgi:rubredoxin
MSHYQCGACFFPYNEEEGLPDEGIAPGTLWKDIPSTFTCPECGTVKAGFIAYEPPAN